MKGVLGQEAGDGLGRQRLLDPLRLRSFIAFLTFVDAFLPYLTMSHSLDFRVWTTLSTRQRCIKEPRPTAVRAAPARTVGFRERPARRAKSASAVAFLSSGWYLL